MLVYWDHAHSVTIISFDVDDLREPEPLRQLIFKQLHEDRKDFLIDLESVVYVSSAVLGFFITLYKDLKEQGGRLKLVNAQPSVSNLFEITRLDRILEMYSDRTTALNSFQ